jgi:hypothetical protein
MVSHEGEFKVRGGRMRILGVGLKKREVDGIR